MMTETEFKPRGEFVELCNLLKLAGVADSGGHGKTLVAGGQVRVDGVTEHRKTAKIRAGQRVECGDVLIRVVA
jgi:ribosome-associated protein